jgi:SAM-dependent methyltransferase
LPGIEDRYDDLKTHQFATMVEIGEADFFPVDDKDKFQPSRCRDCALRGPCPGLFRGYYEARGEAELRPVLERPRSNSFNYVFESLVSNGGDDRCPLLDDGITPWDRGRHLFVKNGARIARFRTTTRDFSDAEIDSIKHERGQIYLDVSKKDAPNDFSRDLVKLARSALCDGCPERERCTGMFEPVWDDVFGRDEAPVLKLIAGLEGDVLDVGCGEGVHEEVFAALEASGRVRYVGIDPDAERLERLRERRHWGELRVGEAEGLDDVARFDEILVLRSWNHLRDPRRALAMMCRALRPGGRLTVVDNEAFGLARTVQQTVRAEHSTAAFEHYRNDSASAAHALTIGLALELIQRVDAGPASSNQWMLRYRSAGAGPSA